MTIRENVERILSEIPSDVVVVAAAKTRTAEEIARVIEAGIRHVGENYVQEAREVRELVSQEATWHMIGHLQTNKVRHAVHVFDMIQTVDSVRLSKELDKKAGRIGKKIPLLIEINSGREPQKSGILPENLIALIDEIKGYKAVVLKGLMTMGPFLQDPEDLRPFFRSTAELFRKTKESCSLDDAFSVLSMGMSDSYRIAIEEGANMVRIGTAIFGPRSY